MAKRPLGDVVVLLPRILGSVLARDGDALPDIGGLTLALALTDLATGRTVSPSVPMRRDADEIHHAEVPPLRPGHYRVQIAAVGDSEGLVGPLHGLVCVVSDVESEAAAP